ncbi:MAG: 4Fe-4S binding protein [Sulfuricella sp.]|nr:4Fe-4S binding protein [Sulfuricella sp.]
MLTQPEYRATRCTRYRYRYSECSRCAGACPHEAVALSDEGITINPSVCRNCALCAAACPTEAILPDNLPRIEILKRAVKLPEVTFACAPSGIKGDEIVPCLGGLDAAMLAYLAGRGVAVTLAGAHHCTECPHGAQGEARLGFSLNAVEVLRGIVGNDKWAEISVPEGSETEAGKAGHNSSRRHLFRRFVGRGADQMMRPISATEQQPVPLKAIRFDAPFSTAGRELLQILFEAKQEERLPLPAHPALFVARVDIRPGCTACEACARACPTGAMQIRESATAWELGFQFSRCVSCGVCVEVCQPRVLHFQDEMKNLAKASSPVTLHALGKQRCARCDRFFISPAPAETCPICEGDDADFASLFG